MKIMNVEPIQVKKQLKEPVRWSTGSKNDDVLTLVKITTDEGIVGWGVAYDIDAVNALRPILLGQDPFDREALCETNVGWRNGDFRLIALMITLSGINIALYDIIGKAVNKPVYKILGGAQRDKIKAYTNCLYFNPTEKLIKIAKEQVDRGFTGIKMKIGYPGGTQEDIEKVKALREFLGHDVDILCDACRINWDAKTAIKLGRELEKYNIYWLEEPLPSDDLDGYAEIKRALNITIAGFEGKSTRYEFRDIIAKRVTDVLMADLKICGGIDEAKKIAAMASAYSMPFSPHCSDVISTAAAIHVSANISNFSIMEVNGLEWLWEELLTEPLEFKNGYLELPKKPGLGIEIDEEALEKNRIK